jgi:hypothetical protein
MDTFLLWFDLGMAAAMLLLSLPFLLSKKGKACVLISGYNMKTPEERAKYDEPRICRVFGTRIALWSIPFFIGFFIDLARPGVGCAIAWVLWGAVFAYHFIDMARNLDKKYLR